MKTRTRYLNRERGGDSDKEREREEEVQPCLTARGQERRREERKRLRSGLIIQQTSTVHHRTENYIKLYLTIHGFEELQSIFFFKT